jgi:phosphoglycolate/pyridoxal phosphate phosphatase family enzyme
LAVRAFVFDLDGVIYRGEQPLPGAIETIHTLRQLGHQVYFFTNNSTQTRTSYMHKLCGMGIPVDEEHIMTSSYATALYLDEQGARGASVYIVGGEGINVELTAIGMRVVDGPPADYVVVGLDREFCYDKLMKAQQAIFKGAQFIATNRDTTFPLEDGLVAPGSGSIVAAVEAASGVKPVTIAKPETPALLEIMHLAHSTPQDTVVVGDRLDTDILVGKRAGTITVLVLTGISKEADVAAAPAEMRPEVVVNYLPEMLHDSRVMGS